MAQTTLIIEALKRALKAHGLTYADAASALDLSEASIKRLFSEANFSLSRLAQLCALMNLEISDIVQLATAEQPFISQLTFDQEEELARDLRLVLVALLVVNNWSFKDILANYNFSEPQLIQLLIKLDRLKMIELLPANRIKRLTTRQFRWRRHGPIQKLFEKHVQREFFNSRFDGPEEVFWFLSGMLSDASLEQVRQGMERLGRDFDDRNQADAALPLKQRRGCSLVFALRPWELPVFSKLRKQ